MFLSIFGIAIVVVFITVIRSIKHYLKQVRIVDHLEYHRPILIKDIKFVSRQRPAYDERYNVHKVNVEVDVPGHGLTNIKGLFETGHNEIEYIAIVIDPSHVEDFIIIDNDTAQRVYDNFIKDNYGE